MAHPERRGRAARPARSSPSATPTRAGSRTRCGALVAAFDDPEVGYACGQVGFVDPDGDNEEGAYWRYEMAVRELESRPRRDHRRQRRHLRGPPRRLPAPRALAQPRPLVSLPAARRTGWRSVYVPAARATEKMVPTIEGEFARKRRMMVGIPDIVWADRMWDPRGYWPRLRLPDPLPPGAALREPAAARRSPSLSNLALLGRGRIYRLALAAQLALLARRRARRHRADPRLPGSPATTCSSPPRSRSAAGTAGATVRPPPGRSPRGRGERRRRSQRPARRDDPALRQRQAGAPYAPAGAGLPRVADVAHRRRRAAGRARPILLVAMRRDPARLPRLRRSTGSAASGSAGREFELLKLRTMALGSDPVGVGTAVGGGRPAGDARRAGCCAGPRSTSCRTSSTSSAARWRSSGRGRRSPSHLEHYDAPPAPPPRRPPGDDRLGAGQRPRRDHLGRADRARQLVRRAPLACASTCGSSRRTVRQVAQRRGPRPGLALDAADGTERGSEVEVRIRPFRQEDAAAVHRWFNNQEAIASLMETRDAFTRGERARAGPPRRSPPTARTASGRSRSRGSTSRSASPPSTGSSARPRRSSAR